MLRIAFERSDGAVKRHFDRICVDECQISIIILVKIKVYTKVFIRQE